MRLGKLAMALSLGLALTGWAQAQPPGGGRGGFGQQGLIRGLERNEALQKDLKLDKDEIAKIKDALTKTAEDTKDLSDKLRDRNLTRRSEERRVGKECRSRRTQYHRQ